jgi:hypothetical protein
MRGAPPDPRDDVHAIGVIWYQLLVGDLTAEAPRGAGWKKRLAARGMAADLIELLEACVASDRADRPADGRELADRLAFALAEPDPGIDLDLSADEPLADLIHTPGPSREPTPTPRPGLAALPAADRHPPRPAGPPSPAVAALRQAATEAREQARWDGLIGGLREILFAFDRIRWAADWRVRLLHRLVAVGLAVGLGVAAWALYRDDIEAANRSIAEGIAQDRSTRQFRLYVWSTSGSRAQFSLSNDLSLPGRFYTGDIVRRGRGSYSTVRPSHTSSPEPTAEQKLAEQVNAALASAAAEYDSRAWSELPAVFTGLGVGLVLAVVLLPLVGWLRRRKLRELDRSIDTTAARLRAEFPDEVADLAEHVELRNPTVVRHLIRTVEQQRNVAPEWNLLGRAFHRVLAPF